MQVGPYFLSDIQDYIEKIIKKHETLVAVPPIYVFINWIIVFKIKYWCKLDLQTPETMKLFGRTKKIIDKTKHGENVPNIEAVEVL